MKRGRNEGSRILTVLAFCGVLLPAAATAADLRITDSRGTQVVVSNAAIDYGGFLSDKMTDGIRLLQGDGTVTVLWADVETISVGRRDDSVKPPRVEVDVLLTSGRHVAATLVRPAKLTGRTELGDYAIDLDKVKAMTRVH